MRKIIVDKKYNNKKLSLFLLDKFNGLTLNTIYKALRKKDIRVNDVRVNTDTIISQDDEITIFILDEYLFKNIDLNIVYEDDNILIIDKPVGIEVVGDTNSLIKLVQSKFSSSDFPMPCHRLDMNTTGLVMFAKNQIALDIILDKFKNNEIEKYYKCTVYGIPKKSEDTLTAYLFKDAKKSLVYISDSPKKGYQKIITSYNLISKDVKSNTSVLQVCLHTGRTHQIRAHLAHIDLPIIGDR